MTILVIDTAAALCAACVFDPATMRERGRAVLDLGKGHSEHVMAVIAEALAKAGVSYAELTKIAVSIGPGSFTGVRVGVSATRGLALALKIPAVGVTTAEALAWATRELWPQRSVLVATKAGDRLAVTLFNDGGAVIIGSLLATLDEAAELAKSGPYILAGDFSTKVAEAAAQNFDFGPATATADIRFFAEVAAAKIFDGQSPKPLYMRPPDAKANLNFAVAVSGA